MQSMKGQVGAALTEYLIALLILIGIFVIGGRVMQQGAESRSIEAAQTEERMVPCKDGGVLATHGGDEACL